MRGLNRGKTEMAKLIGDDGVSIKKPFVVSISATSGGGKTTIVDALKQRLDK